MPAYVVYPVERDRDLFGSAIEIMHQTANSKSKKAISTPTPAARKGR